LKERQSFWPLLLAIILNAAILFVLFWTFHVQVPPSSGNKPMQAQLSSSMPMAAMPAPAPQPAPKPVPKPVPVPKPTPQALFPFPSRSPNR